MHILEQANHLSAVLAFPWTVHVSSEVIPDNSNRSVLCIVALAFREQWAPSKDHVSMVWLTTADYNCRLAHFNINICIAYTTSQESIPAC